MTRIVCLIVAGWAGAATLHADPPLLVGDLGDVQKMGFSGNEAFSTESIRNELAFQLELLPAARKLAALTSLLDVVRELVTRGYLCEGFADVEVVTAFDEQTSHIVVTIVEGTRYQEGEIHLTGIDGDLHDVLMRAVLEGVPKDVAVSFSSDDGLKKGAGKKRQGKEVSLKPLWGRLDYASLSPSRTKWAEQKLKQVLEQQGYVDPELTVRLVPIANDTVELHIDVADVGQAVQIVDVTIDGAQKNSREAMLDLIDIHVGDQWTLARRAFAEHELRQCGRFFHAEVSLVQSAADRQQGTVRVRVRESETIPPLGEPLTPADHTLLKCARWLEMLPHDEFDLVAEVSVERPEGTVTAKLVVFPANGLLLDVTAARLAGEPFRYTMLSDLEHWTLTSMPTQRRYAITTTQTSAPRFAFAFDGMKKASRDGRQCQLGFGWSFSTKNRVADLVQFSIAPVTFLHDARLEGVVHEQSEGVAVFRGPASEARIDEETGRLISFEANATDEIRLHLYTQRAAYEQMRAELDDIAAAFPNVADPDRALPSLADFLVTEFSVLAPTLEMEELASRLVAWQALLTTQLVPRLETFVERMQRPDNVFTIPPPEAESGTDLQMLWMGPLVLRVNSLLFDRDATPGLLTRELTAALLLRDEEAYKSAVRIGTLSTTGPLTCWYAAALSRPIHPQLARAYAKTALKQMETRHLRDDIRELLKGDCLIGNTLRDMATSLRELPPEQIDLLFGLVAESRQRTALIAAVQRPDASIDDVVVDVCAAVWDAWAKKALDQRLRLLAQPPAQRDVAWQSTD